MPSKLTPTFQLPLCSPLCIMQGALPSYANKKGRFHKGSIAGLKAWCVARLVEVKQPGGGNTARRAQQEGSSQVRRLGGSWRVVGLMCDNLRTAALQAHACTGSAKGQHRRLLYDRVEPASDTALIICSRFHGMSSRLCHCDAHCLFLSWP